MNNIADAKRVEEMRECLQRCDRFISNFSDFSAVNIPAIIIRVKKLSAEMDLQKLFSDIKRLAQ